VSRWPDFYVVGAPKCGTTALYEYLRQHPALFLPFHKEPLFFGDDLSRRYGRMSTDQYLALFAGALDSQRIGEASAWYLYSECAAREIARVSPTASIIAMVRQPVDMMHAQHSQLLFNRQEEIADFGEALEAEPARRRGERLPPGPLRPETLRYRETARYAEQLQRYIDVFGRDRVHVIVFDDFRDATSETVRATFEFLDVDPDVPVELGARNVNKQVRSAVLQRLVYRPPGAVPVARVLRRFPWAHRARDWVVSRNSRTAPRAPLDPALRRELTEEFEPEIRKLEVLLGRPLPSWRSIGA
jgi:Sulfotransferase domain